MITKRIIPCLDVKDGRVVKGVNFQKLGDVASPVELAKYYSDNGADLTACVGYGNVFGCQFHPEKSGETGLRILKAFCETEDATA